MVRHKVVPVHDSNKWKGGTAPLILKLGITFRFTTWSLRPRGNWQRYPLNRRLGGYQRRFAGFASTGIRTTISQLYSNQSSHCTDWAYHVLSPHCVAFPMCIAANCSWSFVYCVVTLCVFLLPHVYCFTVCVCVCVCLCIAVLHTVVVGLLARSQ